VQAGSRQFRANAPTHNKTPVTYGLSHHTTQLENLLTIFQVSYIKPRSWSHVYDGVFPKPNNFHALHKNSIPPVSLLCTWLPYKKHRRFSLQFLLPLTHRPTATSFIHADKILTKPRSAGQVCLKVSMHFEIECLWKTWNVNVRITVLSRDDVQSWYRNNDAGSSETTVSNRRRCVILQEPAYLWSYHGWESQN